MKKLFVGDMMKLFAISVLSLLYINCFSQQYSKSWKDLDYAGDSMVYHRLDIYLPEIEKPTYPAVIEIYGSAWFSDNLKGTDLPTLGKALLDAGFAVVMPNHRSSSDAKFPAQIQDIKAVVRFIRANAEKYQIDTSFIGITGYSSGGHLAALAGTSGFVKGFTVDSITENIEGSVGPDTAYSSSVNAVVDWFGPTNFLVMDSCGSSLDHNASNSPESSLIGGPIQDNPAKCTLADPITYVDSTDPPFLIIHGDADPLVPHCDSKLLFNALQKANIPSQFVLVPGGQHGPGVLVDAYFKMMTDFFTRYFTESRGMTSATKWIGTWSTAPQLVETGNNPPSPGLSNNTLRQIVHVSIGGDSLRMRFSNEFSTSPVTIHQVHIAISHGGGLIDTATDTPLYFNGSQEVTMQPDSAVMSDPFHFVLEPLSDVAITIYFGSTSATVTGHPGSRTTLYILTGNEISKADFSGAVTTEHWYAINTIEVQAPDATYAVAILGNSITDGRGSGTNKQDRWPDELARRLQNNPATQHVAVLNEGIGGNRVLGNCLGPSALSRFKRDVLDQNGVRWLIILEGINDIGGAFGSQGSAAVAQNLIAAYEQMIDSAHVNSLLVYGATLLPFGGSFYDSQDHQNAKQTVNDWIRHSGRFDAVIDFDKALRNPADTLKLLPTYDSGDHLHPSETGHHAMAEAVDLTLFSEEATASVNEKPGHQPKTFSLLQNYPNPFNPSTTITFTLPAKAFVTLKIFDSLGRKVATLFSKEMVPGTYSKEWNAEGLPSGTYFARLQEGSYSETRKLILLK
ncbi:MAG: prolyl oligopeptidase family serine peptidase [Bacteroidota bacterium]|nr:prolyl oligopeptidase family serine peptidase [Bacteroidota bacterium]